MSEFSSAALIEADRSSFFKQVFRKDIALGDLLRFYASYHGPLFADQKNHLNIKLTSLLQTKDPMLSLDSVFGADGELDAQFLDRYFPNLGDLYFQPVGIERLECIEILSETRNELKDDKLPQPLNQRSGRPMRAAFSAYTSRGGCLFVGPNQYQYFIPELGIYFRAAALRPFSKDILNYPRRHLNGPVILIQDYGDGSNFAHFTYDWMARAMHILEAGIFENKNCSFIMGGSFGPYQKLLVSILITMYGLSWENFIFPSERLVYEIRETLTFFSDQKLIPLHPAHMAHPRSIELLRRLAAYLPEAESDLTHLFISRRDAKLRLINNEEELISIAEKNGFTAINMSDFSIEKQISIIRHARFITGAHGMGLTAIIFHTGPLGILELFHPSIGTDAYSFISRALNYDYHALIGEDLRDNRGSYTIDPTAFANSLEVMLR